MTPAAETLPAGWPLDFDITLSPAEVERFTSLGRRRLAWGGKGGWWLFLAAVAVGFVLATLLVVRRTIEPEDGAAVAVGGFLACWSGMWMTYLAGKRRWDGVTARSWAEFGGRYSVRVDAGGVQGGIPGRSVRYSWWRLRTAEQLPDATGLWTEWDTLLVIPSRCLPDGIDAAGFAAACDRQMRLARRPPVQEA